MPTKKYAIIGESGQPEYDLFLDISSGVKLYSIHANQSSIWTETIRGKLLLGMTDTGNNYTFTKDINKLEYNDAALLKILLTFSDHLEDNGSIKYVIIEQHSILEI